MKQRASRFRALGMILAVAGLAFAVGAGLGHAAPLQDKAAEAAKQEQDADAAKKAEAAEQSDEAKKEVSDEEKEKARLRAIESIRKQKEAAEQAGKVPAPEISPSATPAPIAPAQPEVQPNERRSRRGNRQPNPNNQPRPVVARPNPAQPPVKPGPVRPGATTPTPTGTGPSAIMPSDHTAATQPSMTFVPATIDPTARVYTFNYDATPWPDVLADFARISGLPLLGPVANVPGTLTFRSPKEYNYDEALEQLNDLLFDRPMIEMRLLEREDNALRIWELPDRTRAIRPTEMYDSFEAMEGSNPKPYDIAMTYLTVPAGWTPQQIIEEFRSYMYDNYGTVVMGDRIQITGVVKAHRRFRDIVQRIAVAIAPTNIDGRPFKIITLKSAKVTDIQNTIKMMFPGQPPSAPRPGVDPGAELFKQVTVVPDVLNNMLLIKAAPQTLKEIEQLVALLDIDSGPRPPMMRIVKLENANAGLLANTLKPIFMQINTKYANDPTRFLSPAKRADLERDITPDVTTNSVILTGGASGIAEAEAVVKQFDVAGLDETMQIITLVNADANAMSQTVMKLFPPNPKTGVAVKVAFDGQDTLIVSAPPKEFEKVRDIVKQLDVIGPKQNQHFVKVKSGQPSALAAMLQAIYTGAGGVVSISGGRGKPGGPPQPVIPGSGAKFTPDDMSGYLIVRCTDEEWKDIEPMITRLEDETLANKPGLKTFELKHADAEDVVSALNQLYPQMPRGPQVQPPRGQPIPLSATYTFFADGRNNTVQVWATQAFMAEITPLVERLDIESPGGLTIIELVNAKAEEIAPILQANFGGGKGGPPVPGQPPGPRALGGGGMIRINAEPITNTLLVTAPAKDLEQIKKMVADMDAEFGDSMKYTQMIFLAQHRAPDEIANTLNSFIGGKGGLPRPPGQPGVPGAAAGSGFKAAASGERVILDGPQIDVARAIQLAQNIDVEEQDPMFKKYDVPDAEETAKALSAMLGVAPASGTSGPAAGGAPGGAPGGPPRGAMSPTRAAKIQIYPDTYQNVLFVAALPREFPRIDTVLKTILGESQEVTPGGVDAEKVGRLWTITLTHKKAYDIAYEVESLLNPTGGPKGGPKLNEGPNEYMLLVDSKPGDRGLVRKMVEMYDVPEKVGATDIRRVAIENLPPELLISRLKDLYGNKVKVLETGGSGSKVQVIDIHADEAEENAAPAPAPANAPAKTTEVGSSFQPCVLPLSLINAIGTLSLGQTFDRAAVHPHKSGDVCPVCHQSPCILPAQMMASLNALSVGGFQDPPEEGAKTDETVQPVQHNHTEPAPAPASPPAAAGTPPVAEEGVSAYVDPISGEITLIGPQKLVDEIETTIEDMTDEKSPVVYRVFPLKYADVNAAATLLGQVFNTGGRQTGAGAATAQASPFGGRGGGRGGRNEGGQPGAQPGQPGQPGQPQPGQQPGQPPNPQQQMIQQMQAQQQLLSGRIKIVPDARTKSLFVIAPLSDIPVIIDVLRKIDQRVQPSEANIKKFCLTNLDANSVADTLREVIGLGGGGGRGGFGGRGMNPQQMQQMQQQQQQMLQMQGQPGAGGQGTLVSQDSVLITSNRETNCILAKAPPDTLVLIGNLIEDLEGQSNTIKYVMKSVEVIHARATELAVVVREIAQATQGGGGGGGGGGGPGGGGPGGGFGGGGGGGNRRGQGGRVSVNADARTNRIILAGATSDVDRVEQIVKDLDISQDKDAGIEQVAVKGDATALANLLKTMYPTGQQNDIVISGDSAAGVVVVKAPSRQRAEIIKLATELDSKVADTMAPRPIKILMGDAEKIATNLTPMFPKGQRNKQAISFKGNKSNNTVYVSGSDDETFAEIKKIAMDMDKIPLGMEVKNFPLKRASAIDAKKKLEEIMAMGRMTGAMSEFKLDLVGVTADARTNSLIVVGGPVTFEMIDSVIDKVDVEPTEVQAKETKSYTIPRSMPASQIATMINQQFVDDKPETTGINPPVVAANDTSNVVTVTATSKQHERIKTHIIEPQVAAVGAESQNYQIQLKFARADEIRQTMQSFMDQWKQARGGKPQDACLITADPNSNSLLVNCSPDAKAILESQLKTIDTETVQLAGERKQQIYPLKYADPNAVQTAITTGFTLPGGVRLAERDQVSVSLDLGARTVIVTANDAKQKKVAELISMMDSDTLGGLKGEYFYSVKNARPSELATTLMAQIRAKYKPQANNTFQVNVIGDDSTNKLVIVASQPDYEALVKTIDALDVPPIGERQTRAFAVKYVAPWTMADIINVRYTSQSRNPNDQVLARFEDGTQSIIVVASARNMTEIEKMILESDKPLSMIKQTKFIPLQNARADEVAKTLTDTFKAIKVPDRQGRYNFTITPDPANNLIVTAPADFFDELAPIVEKLDVKGGRSVHTVTDLPEAVPAKSVAENINKLWGGASGQPGSGVKAEYHEPTNTLLVYSTDPEFDRIKTEIIDVVSKAPATGAFQFYKIKLKNAVADEVAKTLQEFFDKKKGGGSGGGRFGRFGGFGFGGESAVAQAENNVTITAEASSNTLLVYCTESAKKLIDDIIVDIDSGEAAAGRKMEMVALKYMDAAEMIDIMTEYLKVTTRSPSDEGQIIPWWMDAREVKGQEKTVLAGDMRLKAVESTNSVILVGKAERVDEAAAKIRELDKEKDQNLPEMVKLTKANANEVADILTKTFENRGTQQRGTGYQPPTIVAVEATNTLIVKGKRTDVTLIRDMAESLDKQITDEMSGDVRLISVPSGRDLQELARNIEQSLNEVENNRRERQRDYKPSMVDIQANLASGALIFSGSKAKYEDAKRLVTDLVAMAPAGGRETRIIRLPNMSSQQMKQLIDQMQQQQQGGGSQRTNFGGGRGDRGRGNRGDAEWNQDRKYERSGVKRRGKTRAAVLTSASLPVLLANLAVTTAVAQTTPTQPVQREPLTIRPRATTQPAAPALTAQEEAMLKRLTTERTKMQPVPASAPTTTGPTPRELIEAAARQGGMTPSAAQVWSQKLSGAELNAAEAGDTGVIVTGNPDDLDVIEAVLKMMNDAVPEKKIEYVQLKNAQAKSLAETLQRVFTTLEQKAQGVPVRPEDKVDLIADARTNGIFVATTEAKMPWVRDTILRADVETSIQKKLRSFTLQNRRVKEAGESLKKIVASYLKQTGQLADAITVEFDLQTNSVIVTAGESDMKAVEQIISVLDAELPPPEERKFSIQEADVMIVPLRIADAAALGTLMNEMLKRVATGDTPMQDFIRRFNLLDENGNRIETIDLNRPIIIQGEAGSNSLLIFSSRENCLTMKKVAMAFDKEPAKAEVEYKIVRFQYADATEVAEQLDAMIKAGPDVTARPGKSDKAGRPDGEAGAVVFPAFIKADARTNQIYMIARPETMKILNEFVVSLDVKGLDVMPFTLVKLEYANAGGLAEALTELMTERADALPLGTGENSKKAETVIIKGDPRSRSLIIAARASRAEEIRQLVKTLDVPSTALIEDIRTITLKHSTATDLAEKLKTLWDERKQQEEAAGGGSLKLETPAIVADERSNSLIIAAAKGDYEAIAAVVAKIEALELNPMAPIQIVRLQYNSASQLAPAFQTLFQERAAMRSVGGDERPEDKVAIEVDEATNSMIFVGSRENYDVLMQKIKELDLEMGTPANVEFFVATNVQAARIKDTLDQLFEGEGPNRPGGGGGEVGQQRNRVVSIIDERANILIVSASPENLALARSIFTKMNSVTTPWDAAITKMVVIEHGDPVRIAAQVDDHLQKVDEDTRETGEGGGKSPFAVTLFADDYGSRIIVGGTKDGIDRAVALIKQLDTPAGAPNQEPIVYGPLVEANATKIAEMLEPVFEARNEPRGEGAIAGIPVTIQVNESNNTLLVNASKPDHVLVKDLITRLDQRSNLAERVRLFPLEKATATKVKELLDEMFQSAAGEGGAKPIGVSADERSNSLVVSAPPGELDGITALIKRLDSTDPVNRGEVAIIQCENEDAEQMSELINNIITGQGGEGGGGTAAEEMSKLISFSPTDAEGQKVLLSAIRENVSVGFSVRTNSVIVVAPPPTLKLIRALVESLDRIKKREVIVKVFQLQNSDAAKMIEILEELFAPEEGSSEESFQEGREITVEGGATGGGSPAPSGAGAQKGTFGRPKTTFTSDERTNSIIAAGWPEDIDVVADVVDQLDSRPIQERYITVYSLINAKAESAQAALEQFFQNERQMLDALGDSVSPQRKAEAEVSVISHEDTNQLIVSTSPRYKNQVLSVIEQIDMPPPQVMIQVMIAEVTLDDRFEFGMEYALQELRFSETAVAGPNGVLQSSHFDVIGGTDLGAAGSGLGGFSFTITGEDFNFLVRALQSDSRLEVIQRPMLMCQDNQVGNISIGQQVPVPQGTAAVAGQVTTSVTYVDVGVILNIEPHINPDGFVYLLVEPEISSVADSNVQIAPGSFAPIFQSRKASTTVAVKDGETVVIGGLITTRDSEAENKVPFLGDIPGVGNLFRTTTRQKTRTELMIALTPRVVRTVEDGRRLSIESRDESGIITSQMKQSPTFGGLQIHPESYDTIESMDAAPATSAPAKPGPAVQPAPFGTPDEKPKQYGPQAPRYGPQDPAEIEEMETITRGKARSGNVALRRK